MNVTNDPVDGRERENWLSVLPSNAIATAATITVNGAATPAVETISANPKKKLIAGAMLASVAAAMSKSESTPRASRAGAGRCPAVPGDAIVSADTLPPPLVGASTYSIASKASTAAADLPRSR